jgi:hypothetical protein
LRIHHQAKHLEHATIRRLREDAIGHVGIGVRNPKMIERHLYRSAERSVVIATEEHQNLIRRHILLANEILSQFGDSTSFGNLAREMQQRGLPRR